MTPFLALPRKQLPAALGNFCCLPGPQISSFFFDIAKVRNFLSTSKLFRKISTQKSTLPEMVVNSATGYSATVKNLPTPQSQKLPLYLYIYLYIYKYKYNFRRRKAVFLTVALKKCSKLPFSE